MSNIEPAIPQTPAEKAKLSLYETVSAIKSALWLFENGNFEECLKRIDSAQYSLIFAKAQVYDAMKARHNAVS